MAASSATTATQVSGNNTWQNALDRLEPDLKTTLTSVGTRKVDVLSAVLRVAEDKRQLCIRKQWKFTAPNGKIIVVRDVLEKVVGWIDRYKAVGDVASQYDQVHAALPWAAFRFLLSVATGDVQAFGNMVTVLETVARVMARSKVIDEVYIRGPTSTDLAQPLDDGLVLLFAEALVLLAKCVKYFGRSTASRTLLSAGKLPISDDDLKSFDHREAEVLKMAALADAKVLRGVDTKIEALTSSLAGLDTKLIRLVDTSATAQKALEEDKLQGLLGWLSLVPVARHHKEVSGRRLPGSAVWLVDHCKFKDWLTSSSSSILLLHGVRGCGKSTALSAVVDHLLPQSNGSTTTTTPPCAYFYCQDSPSDPDRASPSCVLRNIIRQLAINPVNGAVNQMVVSAYESETKAVQMTRDEPSKPTVEECIRLTLALTTANPAYICIDAMDELSDTDRAVLVDAFQRIVSQSASVVKVFLTSRDSTHLEALLNSETKIRITPGANSADVKAFVQTQVMKAMQTRCLLNGTASVALLRMISEALVEGSGAMFLWVKLQVDFLCRKKTEQDILEALDMGLAGNIDQIYNDALKNILALDSVARRVGQQVISWLLFARRTLQPVTLFSILRFDPDMQFSEPEQVNIIDICHNLIMLDTDTNALSFCHSSVRDFMQQQEMFSPVAAHHLLATACLRQCTAGPGISPFVREPSPIQDFYHYAAVYWLEHARHAETVADNQLDLVFQETIQFIFSENTPEPSASFIIWHEWIRETANSLPLYHPLKYCFELILNPCFSPVHTACVFGLSTPISYLLTTHPSAATTIKLSEPNSDSAGHTPLYLASTHGHSKLIDLLLSHAPDLVTASLSNPCGAFGTPLNAASFRGHVGAVETLLRYFTLSSPTSLPPTGEVPTAGIASAYSHACRGGWESVATVLAKENHRLGLELWPSEGEYDTVVEQAVTAGFRDLVAWLMDPGIRGQTTSAMGVDSHETRERGLLLVGIRKGQVAVVRALLGMGKKWKDALPREALAVAAVSGHADMVLFLHDEAGRVDVEVEGPFGTPLRGASLMGYDQVVRLLLSWSADVRVCGRLGDALQAAAQNGHTGVMRLLLDKGADYNQPGPPRGTCLQAAAYYGHRDAVTLLLDQGANMYQVGESKDALHAAIEGRHENIAGFLLERGYCVPPKIEGWCKMHAKMAPWFIRTRPKRPWEKKRLYSAQVVGSKTALARKFADGGDHACNELSMRECNSGSSRNQEDDKMEWDHTFDNDDNKDRLGELELSAATGNIPDVRQRLLRPRSLADTPEAAFRAATVTGQVEVLQIMLQEAPKHLYRTELLTKALLIAAKSTHRWCLQFLSKELGEIIAGDQKRWASALMAIASSGDSEAVFGFLRATQPRESLPLISTLASAIRKAGAAKHSTVVHVLWHWVFDRTNLDCNHCRAFPTIAEQPAARPSLLERCLGATQDKLQVDDTDRNVMLSTSLGELLAACLYLEDADMVERVLVIMENQDLDARSVMPAFASVCRDGLPAGEPIIRRKTGNFAFDPLNFLDGAYTAASFGHGNVVCILLDELLQRDVCPPETEPVDYAFVGAAKDGHSDILTTLLDTPRFWSGFSKMQATINSALMVAARAGHVESVRVCLQAGADVNSIISAPQDMFYLDRSGELADEKDGQEKDALRRFRSFDVTNVKISHQPAGNGLHMALRGFPRPQSFVNRFITSSDATIDDGAPNEATIQQENIVSMMLENGCDPCKPDGSGQYPIEMAARWANERVLRELLDAGVLGLTLSEEEKARQLDSAIRLACKKQSATAFRTVLELLGVGTKVPTTDDGQLITELLETLELSTGSIKPRATRPHHSYSIEDCRRLMDSGMSALLQLVFAEAPVQKVEGQGARHLLVVAATAGDQDSLELLLRHWGAAHGFSWSYKDIALCDATEYGHLGVMKSLLDAGAEVKSGSLDCGNAMEAAVVGGSMEAVKLLVESGAAFQRPEGQSWIPRPQRFAVEHNHLEALQYLVAVQGRVDVPALSAACRDGKVDLVAYLLSAIKETTPNPLESDGCPLYFASLHGHGGISRQLIEHGGNVNYAIPFGTLLTAAASRGHVDIIRLLLDNGADSNQQYRALEEPHGRPVDICYLYMFPPPRNPVRRQQRRRQRPTSTALSIACSEGFLEVAELLLSRGAAILGHPDPETGMVPNAIASTCEGDWSLTKHTLLELLLETASAQPSWPSTWHGGVSQAARAHNYTAFDLIMEYLSPTPETFVLASTCGSLPSITRHLNTGINSLTPDPEGDLPLHAAAYNLHPTAVSHLLTHGGANQNQLDKTASTPLISALLGFHALLHDKHPSHEYQSDMGIVQFEEIVQCLLNHGARIKVGVSPLGGALDVARLIGHREVERLLKERAGEEEGLGYPVEPEGLGSSRGVGEDEGELSPLNNGYEGCDVEDQGRTSTRPVKRQREG